MGCRRKTEKDYYDLAKSRGFKWATPALPKDTAYPSLWGCKKCGYIWKGLYSNIQCQYWHKGREEQDAKRDMFLVSRGWKVLHIKSNTLLPSKKQVKNIVINSLVETNDCIYNLYLEDWKN